jgi:hypothetical protein
MLNFNTANNSDDFNSDNLEASPSSQRLEELFHKDVVDYGNTCARALHELRVQIQNKDLEIQNNKIQAQDKQLVFDSIIKDIKNLQNINSESDLKRYAAISVANELNKELKERRTGMLKLAKDYVALKNNNNNNKVLKTQVTDQNNVNPIKEEIFNLKQGLRWARKKIKADEKDNMLMLKRHLQQLGSSSMYGNNRLDQKHIASTFKVSEAFVSQWINFKGDIPNE